METLKTKAVAGYKRAVTGICIVFSMSRRKEKEREITHSRTLSVSVVLIILLFPQIATQNLFVILSNVLYSVFVI